MLWLRLVEISDTDYLFIYSLFLFKKKLIINIIIIILFHWYFFLHFNFYNCYLANVLSGSGVYRYAGVVPSGQFFF